MPKPCPACSRFAALLGSLVAAMSWGSFCLPSAAFAQVTVGYSNPIFASAYYGMEERRAKREQVTFAVAGINVRPDDGTLIYDQNTIWQINEPGTPFSLTVSEDGPRLDLRDADIVTLSVSVQRTERVFVQISGPAAEALDSVFPANVRQGEDVLFPASLISVFGP